MVAVHGADLAPSLDSQQLASFRANGYLAIDAITTPDEIRWLREIYGELIANERAFRLHYEHVRDDGVSGVIEQIFMPELLCPKLLETTYLANAKRLASALLGVEVTASVYGGLMLIFKPANRARHAVAPGRGYWEFPTSAATACRAGCRSTT